MPRTASDHKPGQAAPLPLSLASGAPPAKHEVRASIRTPLYEASAIAELLSTDAQTFEVANAARVIRKLIEETLAELDDRPVAD